MKTFTSKAISSEGFSFGRMRWAFEKSLVLCAVFGFVSMAASVRGATFFSRTTQGQVNTWASIWTNGSQTTPVAPTAGNTYELVFNGTPFGSSATGGSVNNTRVRNPYGAGAVGDVQIFPGDSLTLNTNTEFRFKNDNIALTSVDFPGVDGNPGLILNGGVLNAGNDFVFTIGGNVHVASTSLICPADNGAGRILELRGFNLAGSLSGTGNLIICQAGVTVAQEVSGAFNSFSGEWIVKAGWLKGTGVESLGHGNITIDPLALVPIITLSVLSNGPAQLELMYDIVSPGRLTLRNGGKMILHQDCVFGAVNIEGTDLSPGTHPYSELAAAYPNNFAPDGSGSITVHRIITVNTVNNELPGLNETSLLEALSSLHDGDIVRFNIPGPGPHVIVTPIGGYPLITAHNVTIDGYSQPGSSPNTNPILGGNNAQIKIVLDSMGAESGLNPRNPELPLRRSTRLDFPDFSGNTGYGTSENGVLAFFGADNVTVRGLSFIARHTPGSDSDPAIYCVALVREATNCSVQGCWFGLAPGGSTMADVKPAASAVAAFRWRIDGDVFSQGLVFGTDGDGINDRAEFNVAVGSRIALALELPNVKISGNYLNVFPDGLTFVNVEAIYQQLVALEGGESVESIENGRMASNTTIGTDGDGVSDADERNIFAHSVYDHDIEVYTSGTNIVIAGNYFGVGRDGMATALVPTSAAPDLVSLPGTSSVRVGSNGDGVSDDLEGNLIVNLPGETFIKSGSSVPVMARRNRLVNTGVYGVPFAEGQNGRSIETYYANVVADPALARPKLASLSMNTLSGTYGAPSASFPNTVLDLYLVDANALRSRALVPGLVVQPATWLAAYTDNGPGDLDPDANEFSFDLSSFGLSESTYVTVLMTYSQEAAAQNAGTAFTSPTSNPIAARPTLFMHLGNGTIELSWPAPEGAFKAQSNASLFEPANWFDLGAGTYTDGNNTVSIPIDPFEPIQFFRLISL